MVVFTSGTSVFTASRDPIAGGFGQTRMWKNPSIRSAGGTRFVADKNIKKDMHKLTWNPVDPTDLANLLDFLDTIGGSGNTFDYTDPSGENHVAMFWGPNYMTWTPDDIMDREFSIELLIFGHHLTDESGNRITDESGNHILVDE